MPDTVLYCPKCMSDQRFEINADYQALCLGCYDVRDLRPRRQPQAETQKRGDRERRV